MKAKFTGLAHVLVIGGVCAAWWAVTIRLAASWHVLAFAAWAALPKLAVLAVYPGARRMKSYWAAVWAVAAVTVPAYSFAALAIGMGIGWAVLAGGHRRGRLPADR